MSNNKSVCRVKREKGGADAEFDDADTAGHIPLYTMNDTVENDVMALLDFFDARKVWIRRAILEKVLALVDDEKCGLSGALEELISRDLAYKAIRKNNIRCKNCALGKTQKKGKREK